jgi:hypothetical protein
MRNLLRGMNFPKSEGVLKYKIVLAGAILPGLGICKDQEMGRRR